MARGRKKTGGTSPDRPAGSDTAPFPGASAADQIEIVRKLGGQPAPAGSAAAAILWNVPQFYANALQCYLVGNDFVMAFTRPHPASIAGMPDGTAAAVGEPIAVLHLSPGTLKDLSLVVNQQADFYEKAYGKVETDFSRKLEQ